MTLRYSKDHEWVRLDGPVAVVGISDFAQKALGDVVYVDLPAIGRRVEAGEAVAVVESVKAASDVYAPIAGTVQTVNPALAADPGLVNRAPEGEGWFFTLQPAEGVSVQGLMDSDAYRVHTGG